MRWLQRPPGTGRLAPAGYRFISIDVDALGRHAVATLAAVPEPSSLALLAGLSGVALLRRRRGHRRAT